MAIKEEDLITIGTSDFGPGDKVRVLDGDSSRSITLDNFTTSQDSLIEGLGYIKSVPANTRAVRTITADYTVTLTDNVILVDTTAGNVVVTLPAASLVGDGTSTLEFTIKKKTDDSNKVTLTPTGGSSIDSSLVGVDIFNLNYANVISDYFNWYIV